MVIFLVLSEQSALCKSRIAKLWNRQIVILPKICQQISGKPSLPFVRLAWVPSDVESRQINDIEDIEATGAVVKYLSRDVLPLWSDPMLLFRPEERYLVTLAALLSSSTSLSLSLSHSLANSLYSAFPCLQTWGDANCIVSYRNLSAYN